jgi:hypothetical protein
VTGADRRWRWLTKENILFGLGICVIIFEVIHAEVLGRPFHIEFLLLGGALCGVSITQLVDRR